MNSKSVLPSLLTGLLLAGAIRADAGTFTFSNTNAITITDSTNPPTIADPYPATIDVSGLGGTIVAKVTVQIKGLTHSFPDDVDVVLVAPGGQNTVLMGNVGGEIRTPVTNIDLTLDDDAASSLPLDSALVSGTFKPTRRFDPFPFPYPAPAPSAPVGASLANFKFTEPNGAWKLYVIDDTADDAGIISGGWSLTITTMPVLLSVARQQTNVVLSWTNIASGYTLQSTPTLSSPVWSNVSPDPVIVSGNYTVTNPVSTNAMFYRLIK